jgi:LDH2 family malate/lactate/ureidoglycolate dehydrogenase
MANEGGIRLDATALKHWVASVFSHHGLPDIDAATVAEALVDTDMRGIYTHGVAQVPFYLGMLERGVTNPRPNIAIEGQGALLTVQADRALGQVSTMRALDAAMTVAKTQGLAATAISQSGHLGALGYFTRVAAQNGMIAILMQNGPPLMSLPGAERRAIGNNPISFAAPVSGRAPIVFDVSTSEAAFGKLIGPAARGEAIPEGWAVDKNGAPTTDAREALAGMLLPSGGFKGIGMAMMVELLAGSLTATRPVWGGGLFGGFLIVIDPEAALARAMFDDHLAAWLEHYEGSGPAARYPGQRAAETFADAMRNGVPLDTTLHRKLVEIGERAGCTLPAAR